MTPTLSADAELVARLARGDTGALGELFDRHAARVRVLAQRLVSSEADDVTQDVFFRLWRHAGSFDGSRASLPTFLATLTRNLCFDRLRRHARRPISEIPDEAVLPLVAAADPLDGASAAEAREAVNRAVRWLPERERQVIELAYFGGLSQSEISYRTETPLGTVKRRARNALRLLRAVLRRSLGVET